MESCQAKKIPVGLLVSWRRAGVLLDGLSDSLGGNFELRLYLELHLLGLKPEVLQRVSSYFHRYGMEGSVENIQNKSFEPVSIERIIEMVQEGKTCFLFFDFTGTMRVFEDEMLFMTFMKKGYLLDQPAHIVVSANKILELIGVSSTRKRNTRIKTILRKELQARFDGKDQEVVNLDPKTTEIHKILKQPNKTIIAHTNNVGEITAIQEVRTLKKEKPE